MISPKNKNPLRAIASTSAGWLAMNRATTAVTDSPTNIQP